MKYLAALVVTTAAVIGLTLGLESESPDDDIQAGGRSGTYGFDVFESDDNLHLLLVDYPRGGTTPALLHTLSRDGGASWSQPVRVDEGSMPAHVPYRGVDPQLAAAGDNVVAVWTTAGEDVYGYGTGPLATAFSVDGGETWSPGANPADDGLDLAHEFIYITTEVPPEYLRRMEETEVT